jgi:hypothetical protein
MMRSVDLVGWMCRCVDVGQVELKAIGVGLMSAKSSIGVRPRSYILL